MSSHDSAGALPVPGHVSVEALAALLDLLDRPAMLIDAGGRMLARNSAATGLGEPGGEVLDLFGGTEQRCWAEWLAGDAGVVGGRVPLKEDAARTARIEVFERREGGRVALAVLEAAPAAEPPDPAVGLRHDLAGPVTAILGSAELLLTRGLDLPREVRDCLGQILENCGRISEILARSGPVSRADGSG